MEHLSDYYKYLIAGKIAGDLTDKESDELEKLFENQKELLFVYQQMIDKLPNEWIDNKFEFAANTFFWEDFSNLQNARKKQPLGLLFKIGIAAACAGLIFVLAFWFNLTSSTKPLLAEYEKKDTSIQLKLANGKVVDLSKQRGSFTTDQATLTNESGSLTYSTVAGQNIGLNTISVPVGRDYKIVLSDGSKIWMNSMTTLEFPFSFSQSRREISIIGEAYVEVARDASKPFIVRLPNSEVKVLGTEFNVNTYDSAIVKVALVNGAVSLMANEKNLQLKPGEQAVYKFANPIQSENFNSKKVLSWRQGIVYFEYADLEEISRTLQRWFDVQIKIDNHMLRQKRINGILHKNQPLQTFLKDLKFIANIETVIDKAGILHFK